MIADAVNVAVQSAITRGNSSGVAMSGGIARRAGESIASAAPNAAAIANSGHTFVESVLAEEHEHGSAHAADRQEQRRDPPSVEAVGDPPAHEDEQHGGNELGEAEPARCRARRG